MQLNSLRRGQRMVIVYRVIEVGSLAPQEVAMLTFPMRGTGIFFQIKGPGGWLPR